jgi:hypothetical protein
MTRVEDYMPLSIPMECATNADDVAAYKASKAEASPGINAMISNIFFPAKLG